MRPLSAAELLSIWEQGWDVAPSELALALLAPVAPESSPANLAALSIGERDRRILALREATFGSRVAAVTNCPTCGERLELAMQVSDICQPTAAEPVQKDLRISVDDYVVRFRLARTEDLSAIAHLPDLSAARQALLERCLLSARRGDSETSIDSLPQHILSVVLAEMANADPQANVQLAVSCPSCAHKWQAAFDIVSFFWLELDAWAQRLVRDIHTLAVTYGWREEDIVAMSPRRRQTYLDLIET